MKTASFLPAILCALGLLTGRVAAQTPERPNIVWITVEDMSPHLGSYGDAQADTPVLDAFARQAVRFTNTFATAPVCAPARSSIITGVYAPSLGSHNMRSTAVLPEVVKPFPQYLRRAGYYCTNNAKEDYNFATPDSAWDVSGKDAHWRNRKTPEQPFFAVFNFETTHESRLASDAAYENAVKDLPADQRADPGRLVLPPYYPDTPEVRKIWARYYDVIAAMDRQVARVLEDLETDGLADRTIVFYFSDHGMGLPRAKRWLYDSGLRVPLMVRFPPAYQRAAPGSTDDRLVSFVDLAPTMLRLAGVPVPDHMQGQPFLGGAAPRRYVYAARDRMDERYDMIRAVSDGRYKYIRYYEAYKPFFQYMNTPEQGPIMREIRRMHREGALPASMERLMTDEKPAEELFDTQADPHETRNLAASPEFAPVLSRMREAHAQWMAATKDLGLIPEPELRARERRSGLPAYELARRPGAIPVERIRETALLWEQGPEAVPTLLERLKDPDPAVRYWAAVSLGRLPAGDASRAALETSLADPAPVVRVAAARSAAEQGATDRALPILVASLAEEDEWVRLYAANALDEIVPASLPAAEALKKALDDPNKYVARVANHALNTLYGTANEIP